MEDPGIAAIERVYLELKELGVSEEGIKRKLSQLGEGCKIEFDTIVGEAMQIKRDLEERVDTALVDVQKLAAELGEEASDFDDRTLNTYIVDLEDRKESMEEVKADRKAQMNESLSELKALYEEFEEIPPSNHGEIGGTYTEERMRELQHAVERVRDEKKRRRNEVASRVAEISQMWNILGTSLEEKKNTQFADVLLSEGRGSIGLSRDNSKSLESILYSLVEEKERREETIKQLKGQIQKIWERLHISEQARLEFLNGASQGLTMSSVNTCSDELKRLKLLQRQQSEKIIGEIRMNIQNLWEKMRLSEDEQRDTFPGSCNHHY